jgi:hypothetical protein
MDDQLSSGFERRLEQRLADWSEARVRPFDAHGIAHVATLAGRREFGPPFVQGLSIAREALRLGLVAAVLLALVGAALLVAGQLREVVPGANRLMVWVPAGESGRLTLLDPQGTTTDSMLIPNVYHCPHLMPDGKTIVYSGGVPTGVSILSVEARSSDEARLLYTGYGDSANGTWERDGWRVVLSRSHAILDIRRGSATQSLPKLDALMGVAWTHDGRLTLAEESGGEENVRTLDLKGGSDHPEGTFRWDTQAGNGYPAFSWAPDDRWLLFTTDQGRSLVAREAVTGRDITLVAGLAGVDATSSAWSPIGSRVAAWGPGGKLVIVAPDGSNRVEADLRGVIDGSIRWSPDGSRVAVFNGGAMATVRMDGTEVAHVLPPRALVNAVWLPDSSGLVGWLEGGTSRIDLVRFDAKDLSTAPFASIEMPDGLEADTGWRCMQWSTGS